VGEVKGGATGGLEIVIELFLKIQSHCPWIRNIKRYGESPGEKGTSEDMS